MKGLGGATLVLLQEPLQGCGGPILVLSQGLGDPILVHLAAAPDREGLGGGCNPCPFARAAPNREGLGGVQSLSIWVAAANREGLGGSNLCPFARAAPNREGLGRGCNPFPGAGEKGGAPRSADSLM